MPANQSTMLYFNQPIENVTTAAGLIPAVVGF